MVTRSRAEEFHGVAFFFSFLPCFFLFSGTRMLSRSLCHLRSLSHAGRRFQTNKIGVIYGDGVGEEVVSQTVRVLEKVGDWEWEHADAGFETFQREGNALPQKTIDTLSSCSGALFGAVGSPSHKVEGYKSPIIQMRNHFGLYANLRPVQSFPIPESTENTDMLIVRENTECLYVKDEHLEEDGEKAVAKRVITKAASTRIAKMAFEQARARNKEGGKKVTVVHKSNVLAVTDGMFRTCCLEVAKDYPDVEVEEQLVDSMVYKMFINPSQYDVVVAPNLYGDILSDGGAALVGGLGLVPSLNTGDDFFIAEPVHGSAPDIAGQGIANPIACIRSAAMICSHLGMQEEGKNIEEAIKKAVVSGVKTRDLGGNASSKEMTDAILQFL